MSEPVEINLDHEGPAKPGFYLLFTDGNKNPGGSPMIGGLLKYRTTNRRWKVLPGGTFSKAAKGNSIDDWEYEALIEGLNWARQQGAKFVWAYMDRRVIVEQINDPKHRIRGHLRGYRDEVWRLAESLDTFRLSWMPREMNHEADALARSSEM